MSEIQIRMATSDDAEILARHRCEMFKDMGLLHGDAHDEFVAATEGFFRKELSGGNWYGWVVESGEEVVGGAVMFTTLMPPRNSPSGIVTAKLQGLIMNVFVEPQWRRKGIASDLMDTILVFSKGIGAVSVTLHASQKGKPMYEKMGFLPTHEMRLFL